jgi:hypothetical protein
MRREIEAAFPVCTKDKNDCIQETKDSLVLIEDTKDSKCVITTNAASAHFTVNNKNNKNILFVAIDKCIWGDGSGHKKCDFAVTDSNVFAFVEIKDTDNRKSHKKDAKLQLEETITLFSVVAGLKNTTRKAIIAWKYVPTRPVASTLMQSSAVHFWDTYQVELLEGNEMSF